MKTRLALLLIAIPFAVAVIGLCAHSGPFVLVGLVFGGVLCLTLYPELHRHQAQPPHQLPTQAAMQRSEAQL